MKRMTAKQMQTAADRFNKNHKPGANLRVWTGVVHDGPGAVVQMTGDAYVLGGHTAVVPVSGGHGCIALTHVAPAE